MRAAFLVPAPLVAISGGYGYDRQIIAGMRDAGHTIDVTELAGHHPQPDATAIAAAAAAWHALSAGSVPIIDGLGLPSFIDLADAFAERHAVGLIHHPVSLEPHWGEADRAQLHATEQHLMAACARIIVTSTPTAEALTQHFDIDPHRIRVVVPGTAPAPRSPGSGGTGCNILALGSLIPRKGHDTLLRAMARLFDLDWHLTIAGDAADPVHAAHLHALAEDLGIAQRVRFAGVLLGPALAAEWQRTDIFALATQYEGYGMAIAEALRRGIPVAITDGGAAGQLVTAQTGALCQVGDVVTLSKSLRRMIFDTSLRAEMAEAAWTFGQGLPDWPQQVAAFAAALAQ